MPKHVRIDISIEEKLLNMVRKYSPYSVSHTIEKALQEWLLNHCKVHYKLEEDKIRSEIDVKEKKLDLKELLKDLKIF